MASQGWGGGVIIYICPTPYSHLCSSSFMCHFGSSSFMCHFGSFKFKCPFGSSSFMCESPHMLCFARDVDVDGQKQSLNGQTERQTLLWYLTGKWWMITLKRKQVEHLNQLSWKTPRFTSRLFLAEPFQQN